MSYLSIHVRNIVEEIIVCQGTLPVVGEKAYTCEMVERHTRLFGPCTCAVEMIQKKATLGMV